MTFQEWFEQKYTLWEQAQPTRQSYYNFARYLDVTHTALTQWVSGVSLPSGDDLAKLAAKLGNEIYAILGMASPTIPRGIAASFARLPSALRDRLSSAITETEREITQRKLDPESNEAKILAVKIFEKWGFRISG
jgi:transcriptional regulator with XRE-family HTH domain